MRILYKKTDLYYTTKKICNYPYLMKYLSNSVWMQAHAANPPQYLSNISIFLSIHLHEEF